MDEISNIKLSICIPTLNRGSYIGETLQSIVPQASEEVEVVIIDGGSTDNTQQVVEQFQERLSRIRYFRGDSKKMAFDVPSPSGAGFDRDCNRAVELAKGEYCWLFTDDDLLRPGAIRVVLDAIREQYALIVVNAEVRSGDLSQSLERTRLHISSDRVYLPGENQSLFADVANYLSFVGGVVVRRQLWLAREKEPYIGTGFIHIGVLFQTPISDQALVIAEPLIMIRYGDAQYMRSSRYFEIWMFIWPNLIWSLPHFSDTAKSAVCRRELWRRSRTLLLLRAKGAYSAKEYRGWLKERLTSPWDRLVARLVASFPGPVANFFAVLRHHASGRFEGQELLDLEKSPFYFARVFKAFGVGPKAKAISKTVPV